MFSVKNGAKGSEGKELQSLKNFSFQKEIDEEQPRDLLSIEENKLPSIAKMKLIKTYYSNF